MARWCPRCEGMVSERLSECPHCGQDMDEVIVCPEWGEVFVDEDCCPRCGCPVDDYDDDYDDDDYDDDDYDDDDYDDDDYDEEDYDDDDYDDEEDYDDDDYEEEDDENDKLDDLVSRVLKTIKLHQQSNLFFAYGRWMPESIIRKHREMLNIPEDEKIYLVVTSVSPISVLAISSAGLYCIPDDCEERFYSWYELKYMSLVRNGRVIFVDGEAYVMPPNDAGGVYKALKILQEVMDTYYR